MAASTNGAPNPSAGGNDDGLSDEYVDLFSLIRDRAAALLDLARAEPRLVAAVAATVVGVGIGLWLGRKPARPAQTLVVEPLEQAGQRARKATRGAARAAVSKGRGAPPIANYVELIPLAYKLSENPLIRSLLIRAVKRALAKRFS